MERVIETKDLNYDYPDGTCALKDVSIKIKKGEIAGEGSPRRYFPAQKWLKKRI